MRLGFSRPSPIAFTVSGGSFLTSVLLDNGRPKQVTRVQWDGDVSSDGDEITDYIDVRATWSTAQPIGMIAMLGWSCGAGVRVVVTGRRPADGAWTYALGGNSTTQRTVARSDNRIRHIVIPTATDSLVGVQWRIYNDKDSSTWAVNGETSLDLGEAVPMRTEELKVKPGYEDRPVENSLLRWTLGSQPHSKVRTTRRELPFELTPDQVAAIRGQGLASGTDWSRIDAALAGYAPCMALMHYLDESGSLDADALHETALFGVTTERGALKHVANSRPYAQAMYDRQMVLSEAPEAAIAD